MSEKKVLFHVDATQSCGKLVEQIRELDYDMLSISAHKFRGPQGIGALILRRKDYKLPPVKNVFLEVSRSMAFAPEPHQLHWLQEWEKLVNLHHLSMSMMHYIIKKLKILCIVCIFGWNRYNVNKYIFICKIIFAELAAIRLCISGYNLR